ncbi:MAG: hypothetical protein CSA26_00410 [Desulfobacterales bacterium]|nr:MAG: hypothetical protein CSA26_00410 [Desulfobacterales bacterium]
MNTKKKNLYYNVIFVVACAAIFIFLYLAPPETTAPLPRDEDHQPFRAMKKKEAEKRCDQCHGEGRQSPLSPDHPPKYRCLFCHKR